ncbi:PaaI family thioesterase [Emticicia sp. 21SJ11W-3]|uniref:PaaI family thioesterase n=1 Tax=Emticicia sp. 21SJ11W-3 TaxID=2916755 RepID=UPI00209C9F1B|nr:hotdog fold thioesterase [Emticicia sp. 21SJ11W-3]UTA67014.1 hotdog fold thioesterase [Emticicia sp. 21SJ11W-3]
MFKKHLDFEALRNLNSNSMGDHLGIEFVELGEDYVIARMPVDHRTTQPFGILHGGASVALAETLGSIASVLTLDDPTTQRAVGLEINANHVRPVSAGNWVFAKATPLHIGRTTHLWDIKITTEEQKLVCVVRFTVAIINAR